MSVHNGPDASAPVMLTIDCPFRCPIGSCKCRRFQEISVKDAATGTKLGGAKEKFYCCPVPLFQVLEGDKASYDLQMPTCCGGFCVNVCKEGLCNCKIPSTSTSLGSATRSSARSSKSGAAWAPSSSRPPTSSPSRSPRGRRPRPRPPSSRLSCFWTTTSSRREAGWRAAARRRTRRWSANHARFPCGQLVAERHAPSFL